MNKQEWKNALRHKVHSDFYNYFGDRWETMDKLSIAMSCKEIAVIYDVYRALSHPNPVNLSIQQIKGLLQYDHPLEVITDCILEKRDMTLEMEKVKKQVKAVIPEVLDPEQKDEHTELFSLRQ